MSAGRSLFPRYRWSYEVYCRTVCLGSETKRLPDDGENANSEPNSPSCTKHHSENPEAREFCRQRAVEIDANYLEFSKEQEVQHRTAEPPLPSRAESLTDATTLESSGLSTPRPDLADAPEPITKRKRQAAPETFKATPTKRSKRLTV